MSALKSPKVKFSFSLFSNESKTIDNKFNKYGKKSKMFPCLLKLHKHTFQARHFKSEKKIFFQKKTFRLILTRKIENVAKWFRYDQARSGKTKFFFIFGKSAKKIKKNP